MDGVHTFKLFRPQRNTKWWHKKQLQFSCFYFYSFFVHSCRRCCLMKRLKLSNTILYGFTNKASQQMNGEIILVTRVHQKQAELSLPEPSNTGIKGRFSETISTSCWRILFVGTFIGIITAWSQADFITSDTFVSGCYIYNRIQRHYTFQSLLVFITNFELNWLQISHTRYIIG